MRESGGARWRHRRGCRPPRSGSLPQLLLGGGRLTPRSVGRGIGGGSAGTPSVLSRVEGYTQGAVLSGYEPGGRTSDGGGLAVLPGRLLTVVGSAGPGPFIEGGPRCERRNAERLPEGSLSCSVPVEADGGRVVVEVGSAVALRLGSEPADEFKGWLGAVEQELLGYAFCSEGLTGLAPGFGDAVAV